MNILVRLPNWLGDMVMSIGFLNALHDAFPGAAVSVIAKKGIHHLLPFFPVNDRHFIFSKQEYPGLQGAWRFGKSIGRTDNYDLFFSLPDSFSSAVMGFATHAKQRIGYRKELRAFMFTKTFRRPEGMHRVEEYVSLLNRFTGRESAIRPLVLESPPNGTPEIIVININSEASSRRLPREKAVSLISAIRQRFAEEIVLIGGSADAPFVENVLRDVPDKTRITNRAGNTSLTELVQLMAAAKVVMTTDSGPAHVANATGAPTVILFGAGNELNTAPYNTANRTVIRAGQLPCEPCVKNVCVLYGTPKCLELLDNIQILQAMAKYC